MKFLEKIDEEGVTTFSLSMFLAHFLKELLNEIDDKKQKEIIIRRFMDD